MPLANLVADAAAPDPESELLAQERAREIDAAVTELPTRERQVVTQVFGLGGDPREIAHVAAELQLSSQRVRTIRRDALYELRDALGPVEVEP